MGDGTDRPPLPLRSVPKPGGTNGYPDRPGRPSSRSGGRPCPNFDVPCPVLGLDVAASEVTATAPHPESPMPSHRHLCSLAFVLLATSAAQAGVVEFVSNPTSNSTDMLAWASGLGSVTLDASIDFERHPDGEVLPDFYPGATLHAENVTVVHGPGSRVGAGNRPLSEGEGPLVAYQGYTFNGTLTDGWSLTVTFATPVVAAGFMTADVFNAYGDNALTVEAFDGDDAGGSLLASAVGASFNFELNNRYFMGLGDSAGRIKSIRLSIPFVAYGDSQYVDGILSASVVPVTVCTGDLDGDGAVGGADLAIMLGGWGSNGATDLDGSGSTDGGDLAFLLGAWGACP